MQIDFKRICHRALSRTFRLMTLAVGFAIGIATTSTHAAERTVSGVRIMFGETGQRWTLIPTLLDGNVESFVALREDAPVGENITAVWYRKSTAANGETLWQSFAWSQQEQSNAIRAVKDTLGLPDSSDELWGCAIAALPASTEEPFAKGLLASDPLAALVAVLDNPKPVVEMLEDAGWKAAWIDPLESLSMASIESCAQATVLDAYAAAVEVAITDGVEAGLHAKIAVLALCGIVCVPGWVITGPESAWSQWTCGPWRFDYASQGTGGSGVLWNCHYTRNTWGIRSRPIAWEGWDCSLTSVMLQWQLRAGTQSTKCDHAPDGGASCPAVPSPNCTDIPATCGSSAGTRIVEGIWIPDLF